MKQVSVIWQFCILYLDCINCNFVGKNVQQFETFSNISIFNEKEWCWYLRILFINYQILLYNVICFYVGIS